MLSAVVDAHVHVASPDLVRYPRSDAFPEAPRFVGAVEEFEGASERHGVVQAVLVQPSQYGFDNSYLIDAVRSRPGRYTGMALVDPSDPAAGDVLRRLVGSGAVGSIRLGPNFDDGRDWLGPASQPLLSAAGELAVVVNLFVRPAHLADVERWLVAHPELTVVIDHLGRADLAEDDPLQAIRRLSRLARFPELYVKVSALSAISRQPYPHRDTWSWLAALLGELGAQRLMWGADFPLTVDAGNYGRSIELIGEATADLSDGERLQLLGGTARAVYRLGPGLG